jgi:hypothetical protein
MATRELQARRLQYKAAYTAYMHFVHALSDASRHGQWPTAETRQAEKDAFKELGIGRHELLAAMLEHSKISE